MKESGVTKAAGWNPSYVLRGRIRVRRRSITDKGIVKLTGGWSIAACNELKKSVAERDSGSLIGPVALVIASAVSLVMTDELRISTV